MKKKNKGVANAFREVTTFPDIYLEKLNLDLASLASVVDNAQKELENLQSGLRNEIEKRVRDNLSTVPSTWLASSVTEDIVCKIHDSILVEYSAKFSTFEKMLSVLKKQIASLKDRIEVIELKLDDMDQKTIMNTLIFSGLKQAQGASVEMSVKQVIKEKMDYRILKIRNIRYLSVKIRSNPGRSSVPESIKSSLQQF